MLKLILLLLRLLWVLFRGTITQTVPIPVMLSGCMLLCIVHAQQSVPQHKVRPPDYCIIYALPSSCRIVAQGALHMHPK